MRDVGIVLIKQLAAILVALGGVLVIVYTQANKIRAEQKAEAEKATAERKAEAEAREADRKRRDEQLRAIQERQIAIELKADGQHTKALEEIKKAGKYEGAQEAKREAGFTSEQIAKAVEQVLTAQAKLRGRRRNDG